MIATVRVGKEGGTGVDRVVSSSKRAVEDRSGVDVDINIKQDERLETIAQCTK